MRPEFYPEKCCVCGVSFRLMASELLSAARDRLTFTCPCGHTQQFSDSGARRAVEWLEANRPDLLGTETKEQAWAREEAEIQKKLRDIDDWLARRGKYAA